MDSTWTKSIRKQWADFPILIWLTFSKLVSWTALCQRLVRTRIPEDNQKLTFNENWICRDVPAVLLM